MFINYCTFIKILLYLLLVFFLQGNSGTISKSNIILNNSSSLGVVYGQGDYILKECIFDQNKNILIYFNTGTLQLINCYYLTGSYHNSLIYTNTNYYLHSIYSTYYCSYSQPILNPTISRTIFPTISLSFFIILLFQ